MQVGSEPELHGAFKTNLSNTVKSIFKKKKKIKIKSFQATDQVLKMNVNAMQQSNKISFGPGNPESCAIYYDEIFFFWYFLRENE